MVWEDSELHCSTHNKEEEEGFLCGGSHAGAGVPFLGTQSANRLHVSHIELTNSSCMLAIPYPMFVMMAVLPIGIFAAFAISCADWQGTSAQRDKYHMFHLTFDFHELVD